MRRRSLLFTVTGLPVLESRMSRADEFPGLRIFLDPTNPANSFGEVTGEKGFRFPVGLGRNGVAARGTIFRAGSSLLGEFRINAILSANRFEMEKSLIMQSGKSETWLRENLFSNMSSIDFDEDGKGGEYGKAFIGLEPVKSKAKQPFHFGTYKGTFRRYSYAIHGTGDESRIGKCSTGGCINVGKGDLEKLLKLAKIGDRVVVAKSAA